MYKTKNKSYKNRISLAFELLKTFSKKEMEDLSNFVSCKYFNADKYVIYLLTYLNKHILKSKSFSIDNQIKTYKNVFAHLPAPKEYLNRNQVSLLNRKMNDLLRLAERFLSIEALEKNEAYQDELLYPVLLEREQFLLFNRHVRREQKLIDAQGIKDEKYYKRAYQMQLNTLNCLHQNNKLAQEDNLMDVEYNLDMYYLINKLSLHLTAWSLKKKSDKKDYDFSPLEAIQPLVELPRYASPPLMRLYHANIELTKTQNTDVYNYLTALLEEYAQVISPTQLRDFYTTVIGYCISKIREGKLEYEQKIFDIYQVMHNKGLLIEDGYIAPDVLKNIVAVGCRVGEFKWIAHLIEHYKKHIKADIRESIYHFNYGGIAFYQKDYKTAHTHFVQVGKINTVYDINIKILMLKCIYEKEKWYREATEQALRTAERFFKNHQSLTGRRKKAYRNFIQILISLYRIRHREGKRTITWLKTQLEEQKVNSEKRWLSEKIAELESSWRYKE